MRRFLPFLVLLLGCNQEIGVAGFDVGALFPESPDGADWFWQYNNEDFTEQSFWRLVGDTSPDGEAWATFQVWVSEHGDFLTDAQGDADQWAVELYFADRTGSLDTALGSGWYFMGWSAGAGDTEGRGEQFLSEDGLPFAMANSTSGQLRTVTMDGWDFQLTTTRVADTIQFNGQEIRDYWEVELATEQGTFPFEGTYSFQGGPGLFQWDAATFRSAEDEPARWQHRNNDTWANVLGIPN